MIPHPHSQEMSIKNSLDTYSQLSIKLLSSCHARSEEDTEVMLTRRIELFKGESSCLEFAVATKQEEFVAQPAVQVKTRSVSFITFIFIYVIGERGYSLKLCGIMVSCNHIMLDYNPSPQFSIQLSFSSAAIL